MAANYTYTNYRDRVLLWLHGLRIGLIGDGQQAAVGGSSALALDGIVVANRRSGPNALKLVAAGRVGAGSIAFPAVKVGDSVEMVIDLTTPADASASFETVITVAGNIQQSSASSLTDTYLFLVQPQAA